jgi:hypothetical protein
MPSRLSVRLLLSLLTAVSVVASCTSNETPTDPTPDPDPDDPTISLTISPTSASVQQGGTTTFDGTATLGGAFTGSVSFGVTGLPAGVSVSVGTVSVSGTTATATITIDAAVSVAPGTYAGTVTASGSGVSATATYALEVTAAPSYTMSATPGTVSISRGSAGDVTIDLTRTNFADAVTLNAEGLPSDVTAAFSPAAPTGTTSTLTLTVGASAAASTTTVTVRGTAAGIDDVTTTFDLTVTIPAAPDLTIDFSQCVALERPVWVAAADGIAGSWSTVANVNDTYAITGRSDNILGLTFVYADATDSDVSVQYLDASGLSGLIDVCATDGTKTVNGSVAGVNNFATVSLGPSAFTTAFPGISFQITEVVDGPLPLVAYSVNDPVTGAGEMLIRRDQDIPNNGSLGVLDFTTEAFSPATAAITVANLGSDQGLAEVAYAVPVSGDMCSWGPLYQVQAAGSFTAYSAPPAEQQAGELHVVDVTVAGNVTTREVSEAFATLGPRTVTLPSEVPMPTLSDVTGSAAYLRLQADVTLPAEYDHSATFIYENGPRVVSISYVGGLISGSVSLAVPDFSGLSGWNDVWAPPASATGIDYLLAADSREEDILETNPYYCTDGGRYVFGSHTGTYN